ncbi:SLC13 family permease [Streptomyces alkaliterrae]|uniref:Sodium-dependent dicarboxylate transporter SdcS n=1 Tax=Streptomyces alkaliterrae TaxID=2213162 RepID=A0A5P0YPY5_9ACTN|nr:DASS family sodium-coupled anion symporter [Streptomyces alkaliterrae]MBB1252106.1 DASS family sodium-coupled anion symporter [Streptomyces alkaliterrae]MBB1261283.1 DASS family sodium-coupled anion symporter [Streptomyces alkaliterrae]MQS02315.1 DASS family sodium-coupled anion symporter [Streptomyces alkaliterrae]
MSTETERREEREERGAPDQGDGRGGYAAREEGGGPDVPATPSGVRRVWLGRLLAPVLAVLTYFLLPGDDPALSNAARTTAAVAVLVAVWWMTEALPLPVTSLVPIVAFPFLGVLPIGDATAPYASPTVFLFLGGFVIALAMQKWNLHRRIALLVMRAIGTKPKQLILGVMIATGFLSMWVSNTATTLMMLPIGVSVLALVIGKRTGVDPAKAEGPVSELAEDKDTRNFATCLMLAIAYAATIGGLATLIGSPPNLIMKGFVEQNYDTTISFAAWMKVGVPLAVVFLLVAWLLLTRVIYPTGLKDVVGGKEVIQQEIDKLGRMSRGEWNVLAVFTLAALLWVFKEPLSGWSALTTVLPFMANLSDEAVAIAAVVALFLIPVAARRGEMTMDWRTAQSGVPWGVLLLFGGGLSLAKGVQETKLSEWIGTKMGGLEALPTVLLIAVVCLIILALTELTSNTATASTFLPVLGGVAIGIGIDPLLLLAPAALAATCSFMLPVGTPPNAIVFGSGHVTMGQMIRGGIWLNLVGVLLITAAIMLLGGWALGVRF